MSQLLSRAGNVAESFSVDPSSVGIVGLGATGSKIAARLLSTNREVVVGNRTSARLKVLIDAGAHPAASPADLASRVATVIIMVSDVPALTAVTEETNGIVDKVQSGALILVMSTVDPNAMARLAAALPADVNLLDAPVLGSITEAEQGKLRIFVGGSDRCVRRAAPMLGVLGTAIHVGDFGMGMLAKLIANSILFGVLGVLGEALGLAYALGLSHEMAFDILSDTPLAVQASRRRPAIEVGEFPSRFRLSLARKDAELILAAAASVGQDVKLAAAVRSWLVETQKQGWGEKDYTAMLAKIIGTSQRSGHVAN